MKFCYPTRQKTNYSWGARGRTAIVKYISFKGSQGLIGSITSRGGWFVSRLHSNNNSDIFIDYVQHLIAWLTDDQNIDIRKVVLLMDNSPIHSSKKTLKYLNELGWKIVFSPPYSPEYWPIELLFNYFKAKLWEHWKGDTVAISWERGWRSIKEWIALLSHEMIMSMWTKRLK